MQVALSSFVASRKISREDRTPKFSSTPIMTGSYVFLFHKREQSLADTSLPRISDFNEDLESFWIATDDGAVIDSSQKQGVKKVV